MPNKLSNKFFISEAGLSNIYRNIERPTTSCFARVEPKKHACQAELLRYFPIGIVAASEGYFRLVCRDLINFGDPCLRNAAQLSRIREEQLAMPFFQSVAVRIEPRPFLKWAGGKSSLLNQFDQLFPRTVDRYFEPFVGGGAVFFHLKHRFPAMRAFLRDSNKELINCYRIVRDRPIELMRWLDHHQKSFRSEGAEYYYRVRKENDLTDDLARAARTLFLNKACFNGLFRVNARGEFNMRSDLIRADATLIATRARD